MLLTMRPFYFTRAFWQVCGVGGPRSGKEFRRLPQRAPACLR
jgi:hypothetical protein